MARRSHSMAASRSPRRNSAIARLRKPPARSCGGESFLDDIESAVELALLAEDVGPSQPRTHVVSLVERLLVEAEGRVEVARHVAQIAYVKEQGAQLARVRGIGAGEFGRALEM